MDYSFLLVIAAIMLSTKILGLASERVHMPQVVGALIAGLLIGPSVFGIVGESDFLTKTAEIGVILLMFTAGLDTNMQDLKNTGISALVIAAIGVVVPFIGGAACYLAFYNDAADSLNMLKAAFIGVVLTATSVSITVETLREMGKLKSKVGTAIMGAAVIDDVLGIIVLTVLTGFTDSSVNPVMVFVRIIVFFVFIGVVGFIVRKIFARFEHLWGEHRRIAIYALAFCFILSYCAEGFFGIADITGAYFAGLILCDLSDTRQYAAKKMNVMGYMLFSPIFFASIGIKTDLSGFGGSLVAFAIALTVVAIVTKIIGCGLGARLTGFGSYDSMSIGLGMVSRGEVALIVAQKGAQAGLVSEKMFPAIVLMVIVTTLVTPLLLKVGMKKQTPDNTELPPERQGSLPRTDYI